MGKTLFNENSKSGECRSSLAFSRLVAVDFLSSCDALLLALCCYCLRTFFPLLPTFPTKTFLFVKFLPFFGDVRGAGCYSIFFLLQIPFRFHFILYMCVFLLSSFLCSFSRSVSLVCSCIRLQKRRKAIVHPLAIHMRWYKARLKPGQRCFPVFLHSAMDLLSSLFQHWFVVFMMLLPLLLLCANILCHAFPSTRLHVAGYFLFSSHFLGCLFCRFLFLVVFLSFIYSRVHVLKSMCFSSEFRRFSFDVDFCNILSSRFVFSHWLRVCLCVCASVPDAVPRHANI